MSTRLPDYEMAQRMIAGYDNLEGPKRPWTQGNKTGSNTTTSHAALLAPSLSIIIDWSIYALEKSRVTFTSLQELFHFSNRLSH